MKLSPLEKDVDQKNGRTSPLYAYSISPSIESISSFHHHQSSSSITILQKKSWNSCFSIRQTGHLPHEIEVKHMAYEDTGMCALPFFFSAVAIVPLLVLEFLLLCDCYSAASDPRISFIFYMTQIWKTVILKLWNCYHWGLYLRL